MGRSTIKYPTKDIPTLSKDEYEIQFASKVKNLPKEWDGELEFLGKLNRSTKETYGFTCRECPPVVPELIRFTELKLMIKKFEHKRADNYFFKKANLFNTPCFCFF